MSAGSGLALPISIVRGVFGKLFETELMERGRSWQLEWLLDPPQRAHSGLEVQQTHGPTFRRKKSNSNHGAVLPTHRG
jgi:hypothetical protein